MQALDRWSGADAAELALAAAGQGARALVIRNTVDRAREIWHACVDAAPELVLALNGIPDMNRALVEAATHPAQLEAIARQTAGKAICAA